MPVPDFSPGEVLTAAAMDSIGLWKIAETSFTTAATPFIDGCFSADYENYVVVFRGLSSLTGQYTNVQLRAATVAKATNYSRAGLVSQTGGVLGNDSPGTGQNGWRVSGQSSTGVYATMNFYRPFTSAETGYTVQSSYIGNLYSSAGTQTESYSADGFQIIANGNAATFTGTLRVYGYRN
jgi:hypothetical protein